MPTPPPEDERADGLSRRSALGLIVACGAAAAGCTPMTVDQDSRSRPTPPNARLDPDVALAATALIQEQNVLDVVLATQRRHKSLRPVLADAQNALRQHLDLLVNAVPSSPSNAPDTHPWVDVPTAPAQAVLLVARREEQLSQAHRTNALSAQSGVFARLLASMAASAAQHGATLREHASTARGDG